MKIWPFIQIKCLFFKMSNLIFRCIYSIISVFLLKNNQKAYNFKPLVSFGSIIVFMAINVIMPDWNGFWELKDQTTILASYASEASLFCNSFRNTSETEKVQLNYNDKANFLQQRWWNIMNDLFAKTNDQYQGGKYGRELYLVLDEFRKWNLLQLNYFMRYNTCSPDMLTLEEIGDKRDDVINKLPLTVGEYIRFYIEVRLLGKGIPFDKEKASSHNKEEAHNS